MLRNFLVPLVAVTLLATMQISIAQAQGQPPGPGYRWVPATNSWVGPPVKHKSKFLGEIVPRGSVGKRTRERRVVTDFARPPFRPRVSGPVIRRVPNRRMQDFRVQAPDRR